MKRALGQAIDCNFLCDQLTGASLARFAVNGGDVPRIGVQPLIHVRTKCLDLFNVRRIVIVKRKLDHSLMKTKHTVETEIILHQRSRAYLMEFPVIVVSFRAQVVHSVHILVPRVEKSHHLLDVVAIVSLHFNRRIAHGDDVLLDICTKTKQLGGHQ